MPDDTGFVQQIAAAEKNGNYKEAFDAARNFIYGDPTLFTSSNAAGWKDRATQLSNDLVKQNIIPPFSILDSNGIEVNPVIPPVQSADSAWHVSYASGMSLTVSADKTITIADPTGAQSGTFKWDSTAGRYVEELDPPHQLPLTVELVKSDSHQPTVIVHDEAQRTDTIYSDNGDITVNNLGGRGQISWSTTVQANGVQIYTEGGPEHPDRKDIRYPDGTTISVAGSQIKDNQGNPKSWTTTINSPNFHDQTGQLNLTLDSDITDGQTQLPPTFSFQVVPGGPSYEIDNRTLTLSVPGGGKYYMNGVQPEIDEPSTPLVQQTATATPFSDPPDLFSDIATSDSTPVPDSKR